MMQHNIRSLRLIVFLFLLSLGSIGSYSGLYAQNVGKPSNLYMQVQSTPNKKLSVAWAPLDTFTFKAGFKQGYTLTRYDSTTKQTTVLSDRILPQDTMAIKAVIATDSSLGGYYGYLWRWLWIAKDTPTIQLRYSQIISNGHNDPQTAVLSGLGFIDTTTLTSGGRYRYDVKLNDGSLAAQVGFSDYSPQATFATNGVEFPTNLEFGDYPPLSTMIPRKRPIQVFAVAKAYGDSVCIRWSPDSYESWVNGNKDGYQVRRRELTKDGVSREAFLTGPFRPLPLAAFAQEPFIKDTGCIIAAQALYGEDMTISGEGSLTDKADQSQMRFTIAQQAADKSFFGALALGLGMIDTKVDTGKTYIYDIIPISGGIPGTVMIRNSRENILKPQDLKAQQGDHWIQLSWNLENKKLFSFYQVYRSDDDGKTYNLLTPSPIGFLFNGAEADTFRFTFSDSIPTNYKPYKYRLSGLDFFATWSPFAEITAFGRDLTPPAIPSILEGLSTTNSFELKWKIDTIEGDLAGFQVFMSNSMDGDFKPITKMLSKDVRQYTHQESVSLARSYYFKVVSIDTAGNAAPSGPYYVIVIDSIPPLAPGISRARVNKQGLVRIAWQHGTEADLAGYRVFSSTNNQDFKSLTPSPLDSNIYWDTLPLNTLNRKMYYKVLAEDQSGNQSPFTAVMLIEKPDTMPPVMPVLEQPESGGKGVTLKWVASSSNDVMAHLLYRKPDKDTTAKWTLIQTLDGRAEWYTDTTAFIEQPYVYYMVAQDSAENISEQSLIVGGRRFFDGKSGGIQTVNAAFNKDLKNVQVSWQTATVTDPFLKNKDYVVFVYRGLASAPLEKYQQVADKKLSAFTDDEVSKGQYRYALCVVYDDGKMTPLTQEVVVDIE